MMIGWIRNRLWRVTGLAVGVILWLFGDLGPEPANLRAMVAENWRWLFPGLRWVGVILMVTFFLWLIKDNTDTAEVARAEVMDLNQGLKDERRERVNAVRSVRQTASAAHEIAGPATSRLDALESRMTAAESRVRLLEARGQEQSDDRIEDDDRSPPQ